MNSSIPPIQTDSIKEITHLIYGISDDSIYRDACQVIQHSFGTHTTLIIELTEQNTLLQLKGSASVTTSLPTDNTLLTTLVDQYFCLTTQSHHAVLSGFHQHVANCLFIIQNSIEGYIGTEITPTNPSRHQLLISLTSQPIAHLQAIDDLHQLIARILIKHAEYTKLQSRSDTLLRQLKYEVSHDNLTQLKNRSALADTLERHLSVRQQPQTLSLGLLDIDRFKYINDIYGSYLGDQVLIFVARALSACIQDDDLIFRIGGDEFAFITYDLIPEHVCQQVVQTMEAGYQDTTHLLKLSVSIGLAHHEDAEDADQMMLNASLALAECKRHHYQQICCYQTYLKEQYYQQMLVIEALRCELNSPDPNHLCELSIVLHPIVNQCDTQWQYFEVLTRWHSHKLGKISPDYFITAAEQCGLMPKLGQFIFTQACLAKQRIEHQLNRKIRLSINCSALEINQPNSYVQFLTALLADHQFDASEFTLEITETALLTQRISAKHILDQLRHQGFRIALDDFGTGYSSLNYIHTYPIDNIKIDASFVKNMRSNQTSEKVVKMIIQLATQLNVDLVAEGVEDVQSLTKLHSMGCKNIQGFYYSQPLSPEELIHQLKPNDRVQINCGSN